MTRFPTWLVAGTSVAPATSGPVVPAAPHPLLVQSPAPYGSGLPPVLNGVLIPQRDSYRTTERGVQWE